MQPHFSTELRSRCVQRQEDNILKGQLSLGKCAPFGRPLDTYTKTLHLLGTPRHAPELTRASETEAGGNRSAFSKHGISLVVQYHLHAGASGAREPDSQKGEPCSSLLEGTLALTRETGPHLWSPSREDHGSYIQQLNTDGSTLP